MSSRDKRSAHRKPGVRNEQTAHRSGHARRRRRRPCDRPDGHRDGHCVGHGAGRSPSPPPSVHPTTGALEAVHGGLHPGGDRCAVRHGQGATGLPAPAPTQDQPRRLPSAAHVVAREVPGHHAREPGRAGRFGAGPVRPRLPGHHSRPGEPHLRLDRVRPPRRALQPPLARRPTRGVRRPPSTTAATAGTSATTVPATSPRPRRSCRPGSSGPPATPATAPRRAGPGSCGTSTPSTPCGTWRASVGRSGSGS